MVEVASPFGETEWPEKPELICLDTRGLTIVSTIRKHDATTRLGDGSAREPKKVVTSCDKSRGEA